MNEATPQAAPKCTVHIAQAPTAAQLDIRPVGQTIGPIPTDTVGLLTAAKAMATLKVELPPEGEQSLEAFERTRPQPLQQAGPAGRPTPMARPQHTYTAPPPPEPGMELSDVSRRIFRRHWRLIVLCAGIAAAVAGLGSTVLGGGHMYTGSARFVLDTADPKTRSEAQAIADMAKGLATSPALVRAALAREGADRSAVDVAKRWRRRWRTRWRSR